MSGFIKVEKSLEAVPVDKPVTNIVADSKATERVVRAFLKDFLELYVSDQKSDLEWGGFLKKTHEDIKKRFGIFDRYRSSRISYFVPTTGGFSMSGLNQEHWLELCLVRSRIEVFNHVYKKLSTQEQIIDTSDVDDHIKNAAPYESYDVTKSKPKNLPGDDWWWELN